MAMEDMARDMHGRFVRDNLGILDDECYYLGAVLPAPDLPIRSVFSITFRSGLVSIFSWVDDPDRRILACKKDLYTN
ncbi:hypothetical protein SADUNF_Sadunf17G0107100 [Salix dunnii]|uniref:Uncharacterized protein n=1 Tax=Salix dunnii TaxID=1413687 RepID=A0A835MEY3_9ROSI|nr:hypothetical protein SADUNF_Sadunf17G0107100 [Salix dunnii]